MDSFVNSLGYAWSYALEAGAFLFPAIVLIYAVGRAVQNANPGALETLSNLIPGTKADGQLWTTGGTPHGVGYIGLVFFGLMAVTALLIAKI